MAIPVIAAVPASTTNARAVNAVPFLRASVSHSPESTTVTPPPTAPAMTTEAANTPSQATVADAQERAGPP